MMIRKLRMKFIAISMISTMTVLFLIIGSINLLNYREMSTNADTILNIMIENDGSLPDNVYQSQHKKHASISPETSFESRYFTVFIKNNTQEYDIDTDKIAAVDQDKAARFAQKIQKGKEKQGFISKYRYIRQDTSDGTKIYFLDCTKSMTSFRNFLVSSVFVSIFGVSVVFVLVLLLSKKAIEPVAESYEKQKRFITDAGHEIKTPLTIIDADTTILEMEYGENEWFSDITVQTKRLADLTNDLIYLSKMEEEGKKASMIEFPFSDVVEEVAQSFQNLAKVQNKKFITKITPMISLKGDEKAIRQLISILLNNAVKYCGENGEIRLSVWKKGKNTMLSVYNTTQEMKKENLNHLFDRFYRTDASRNSQTGGYGIGLSIAKAVTTAHKGKIQASSEDGKSLLITVTL